jgi:hypothetical protein
MEVERHKEAIDALPVNVSLIASFRERTRLVLTRYFTQIGENMPIQSEVK